MARTPVAVVTGASRGIGKVVCRELAAAGYDVVCAARSTSQSGGSGGLPGTIDETAALVEAQGQRAMPVALDVRDEPAVAALAKRVAEEWGPCDLLVNNAAIAPPKPALDDSPARFKLTIDINLLGAFYLSYHFGRQMREAGEGRIVDISSAASQFPDFGRAAYTASKRGLEGLSESLAHDLAGKVAVNCIRLELMVWTEGFDATLPDEIDKSKFEDPIIMSDAVLWLARQPIHYTGHILTIEDLRAMNGVRPKTRYGETEVTS